MSLLSVTGVAGVNAVLVQFPQAANDEGMMTQLGAVLLNRIKARFLRQEAPDGTTWPISMAARNRAVSGRDGGTLFDTGALYHSIDVKQPGPMKRAIYTNIPYAAKHQWGEDGLPQRVFVGFSNDDIDAIETVIRSRLESIV